MKKSIKIILIISLTINFIFIISGAVIGIKAWSFKNYYWGDHHHGERHGGREYGREGKINNKNIIYFLRENEKIREKIGDMRDLRREAKDLVEGKEEPLSLEEIKSLLERLESDVIELTQITHEEIYTRLENMSEEERQETLDFLFRRR